MKRNLLACLALALSAGVSNGAVIISEIFYNLNGSEGALTEWVEVTNTGSTAADISGWFYGDIQDNQISNALPTGSVIPAGGSAVIVAQSAANFQSMWGAGVQVINFTSAADITIANSPSATNESMAILDSNSVVVDEVNLEAATNGWPAAANGASIYLLPNGYSAAANDVGANWAISTAGVDGAYAAFTVNPDISNATLSDVASPGVAVYVPEPAAAMLVALALAASAARRQ